MLAQPDTAPREASPAMSDGLSSSLSELDYLPEEPKSPEEAGSEDAADSENDTEAETERLVPSPNKPSRSSGLETTVDVMDDTKDENEDAEGDDDNEPTLKGSLLNEDDVANVTRNENLVPAEIRSPTSTAGTKRKRSSSLTEPIDDKISDLEPPRKRPSIQMADSTMETAGLDEATHTMPSAALDVAPGKQADSNPDEQAAEVQEELEEDQEEAVANQAPFRRKSKRRQAEDPQEDVQMQTSETNMEIEGPVEPEPEDEEHVNADEEDVDAPAREDEIARKKEAFEALAPIEEQFAIFRDKLYDERLAMLDEELESLKNPNTAHPVFLEMRQAIDARRDDKIQLENVWYNYRNKALEQKTVAERTVIHSQSFQSVRDLREKHLASLNEQFAAIQRDRKQKRDTEPQYSHLFNPKRSDQILNQQAYNKEVSLLSGIAKHKGFPAAPKLAGATPSDIEEDLKRMRVNAKGTPSAAQIANSNHVDEMAGEQGFYEKNPWARNRPPMQHSMQHVMLQNRQSPPFYTTPANAKRAQENHQAPPTNPSTIGTASDPPSSVRAQGSISNRVQNKSPLDGGTRRPAWMTPEGPTNHLSADVESSTAMSNRVKRPDWPPHRSTPPVASMGSKDPELHMTNASHRQPTPTFDQTHPQHLQYPPRSNQEGQLTNGMAHERLQVKSTF
ncbi:MAG: hypothetical protein M1831_002838 [Alyxoria varia]|nr:MAG: hypothetical protein M1831_002838 [Alyxoria varia]